MRIIVCSEKSSLSQASSLRRLYPTQDRGKTDLSATDRRSTSPSSVHVWSDHLGARSRELSPLTKEDERGVTTKDTHPLKRLRYLFRFQPWTFYFYEIDCRGNAWPPHKKDCSQCFEEFSVHNVSSLFPIHPKEKDLQRVCSKVMYKFTLQNPDTGCGVTNPGPKEG